MSFFKGRISHRGGALRFEEEVPAGAPGGLALALDERLAGPMKEWAERKVILGIRPEHIARRTAAATAPGTQTVEAVVEVVQPLGAESYLSLAGAAQSFLARVPATEPVHALQRISLVFDMARAHFFDALTEKAIGSDK